MKPPKKVKNSERRVREYLTPAEVDKLIASAKQLGRHGLRDSTMILIAYRHGLRVSELISLRWSQIDLKQRLLHVIRKKKWNPIQSSSFWPRDSDSTSIKTRLSRNRLCFYDGA